MTVDNHTVSTVIICARRRMAWMNKNTNQRVDIHYNCIGAFEVPDRKKIPEADIIMETRKVAALSYAPEQVAVWTLWEIKKQSVHYRILRSYKDTLHGPSD